MSIAFGLFFMRILLLLLVIVLSFSSTTFGQTPLNHNYDISDEYNSVNPFSTSHYCLEVLLKEEKRDNFFTKDSLTFFPRLGYTNLVMLSSSFAGHAYLILRTRKEEDWSTKYSWQSIERSFTLPPKWDEDHWSFNYLVHPYMGSLTYLAWRNRGGSMWSGLLVSGINSAIYEYLLASAIQRPSANDLIITPLSGLLLGEAIFRVERKILQHKELKLAHKIILTIIDPYEVVRNRFRYDLMK